MYEGIEMQTALLFSMRMEVERRKDMQRGIEMQPALLVSMRMEVEMKVQSAELLSCGCFLQIWARARICGIAITQRIT